MTQDFYLKVKGIELFSEREVKVVGDVFDLVETKVSGGCTLYLPISIDPYPQLGQMIRLSLPGKDKMGEVTEDTKILRG